MSVAVACEPDVLVAQSEWVDPEGDDWLASLYRFLTEDEALSDEASWPSPSLPELEHWFG
ncbi:MAG TPA: hypothetical protein VF337_04005 [Candidatus Limnocylindrales bacterium]